MNGGKFDKKYVRDINNSYIVYNASKMPVEEYQKAMLIDNQITGLLPINFKNHNGESFIYYNITSKISLEDYVNHNKLNYNDIKKIITGIQNISNIANAYLLCEDAFEINSQSIFFEPGTNNCYFIYIPIDQVDTNLRTEIKELIQYMFHYVDKYDEKGVKLIHQLKIIMEADGFSLLQFSSVFDDFDNQIVQGSEVQGNREKLLSEVPQTTGISKAKETPRTKGIQNNKGTRNRKESQKNQANKESRNKRNRLKEDTTKVKTKNRAISKQNITKKENNTKKSEEYILPGLSKMGLIIILVQMIMIGGIYFVVSSGTLYSENQIQMGIRIGYLVVCVVAIEGILLSINKYQGKTTEKKKEIKNQSNTSNINEENRNYTKPKMKNEVAHTEVLTPVNTSKRPYLIKDNIKIPVIKTPFIIGKLEEEVDCPIQNPLVSRVHGEISMENNVYFYKDLNSRNGTYLNNEKLESNQKYAIENNVKICFANEKYVFRLL